MTRPPRLLVSVRNADEALAALEGGADIIDIKEPARGPMGMADVTVMEQVVAAVAGRRPISVALGELADRPPVHHLPPGVSFAKVALRGMANEPWHALLRQTFASRRDMGAVVVHYADGNEHGLDVPAWPSVCRSLAELGLAGVLIDTAVKGQGDLFDTSLAANLNEALASASPPLAAALGRRGAAMAVERPRRPTPGRALANPFIALAGALAGDALSRAAALGPDIIAVRGAACIGGRRDGRIDLNRVRLIAQQLAAPPAAAPAHSMPAG